MTDTALLGKQEKLLTNLPFEVLVVFLSALKTRSCAKSVKQAIKRMAEVFRFEFHIGQTKEMAPVLRRQESLQVTHRWWKACQSRPCNGFLIFTFTVKIGRKRGPSSTLHVHYRSEDRLHKAPTASALLTKIAGAVYPICSQRSPEGKGYPRKGCRVCVDGARKITQALQITTNKLVVRFQQDTGSFIMTPSNGLQTPIHQRPRARTIFHSADRPTFWRGFIARGIDYFRGKFAIQNGTLFNSRCQRQGQVYCRIFGVVWPVRCTSTRIELVCGTCLRTINHSETGLKVIHNYIICTRRVTSRGLHDHAICGCFYFRLSLDLHVRNGTSRLSFTVGSTKA